MRIKLTKELAHAAGWDAGNASMRKAGRTKWNRADYNLAARTTNRLLDALLAEENPQLHAALVRDGML